MKLCPKCHLEYDDDCMFCNKCGSKLDGENDKSYCQYCGRLIDKDSDGLISLEDFKHFVIDTLGISKIEFNRILNLKKQYLKQMDIRSKTEHTLNPNKDSNKLNDYSSSLYKIENTDKISMISPLK